VAACHVWWYPALALVQTTGKPLSKARLAMDGMGGNSSLEMTVVALNPRRRLFLARARGDATDNVDYRCVFLTYPRVPLMRRIDERCEHMIRDGLVEVRAAHPLRGRGHPFFLFINCVQPCSSLVAVAP